MAEQRLAFADFQLDLADERLWRGSEAIPAPEGLCRLRHLCTHPAQLVTKGDLLNAV